MGPTKHLKSQTEKSKWYEVELNSFNLILMLAIAFILALPLYNMMQKSQTSDVVEMGSEVAEVNIPIDVERDVPQVAMYSKEWKKSIQGTKDDVHIVFTSSCSGYQNWQAENLLYSWARIQHPGRITRVIAGCQTEEDKARANRTAVPNPENRIQFFFVPDYTPSRSKVLLEITFVIIIVVDWVCVDVSYRPFLYFNKPYGMLRWLKEMTKNAQVQEERELYESFVICVDPDMILMRPLLFHLRDVAHAFAKERGMQEQDYDKVWLRKGHPVSQKYGIGPKWTLWGHCPMDRPGCAKVDEKVAWNHYSVGPPYMMHTDDWLTITPQWVEFSPGALEKTTTFHLAEMYSYSIACA
ncbi:hypothetical protein RFI_04403 [Reticulomyxa filosa]|uniref:Uncharacterized protein n=1 Tax=Reticulomyxa filosa TaxID=46433 RepID=X6P3P8_RETFI|nr:hypothetical protein RFI_04403 [Reticulomyxa filosa]|eukprot:ETO32714.1 hypothetical protein RFI_04403 [Reticulomyxa filosa]